MSSIDLGTQARKLGLRPGCRVFLDEAPSGWRLEADDGNFTWVDASDPADVIVAFFREAADLPERLDRLVRRIYPSGALWVAWPRRAAGHVSDLGDQVVRDAGLARRVVDIKVAAIDDDWSGLKFVWRKELRGTSPRG